MQYTILLDRSENTKQAEFQEQSRFIKAVLEALELPMDFNWNPDEPLSVEERIKLRKNLEPYRINIISDMDGGIKIFAEKDLIAEWYKCKYKLKQDLSQIDPKKRLFNEMTVNFWTIFEEEEGNNK